MQNKIESNDHEKKKKEGKIISNKAKNYLNNLLSHLLNNKNNFEDKIQPSDLEFKLETNSEDSFINQLIYKLEISNSAFNPKRDIVNNIKNYKSFPIEVEMFDEYYSNKTIFQKIELNLYPVIKKGIILDLSVFPFYTYNKEIKKIDKFKIMPKNSVNKKFTLCIYIFENNETGINKINKMIDDLNLIDKIWEYFENIYVIFQLNTTEHIISLIGNKNVNKYIFNDNSDENNKIFYIFNVMKNYENTDTVINIFQDKINSDLTKDKGYFFILDEKNKIIKIKNLSILNQTISYFIFNLKSSKEKNIDFFQEKEKNKIKKLEKMKEILNFISELKNLDYIFDIEFNISINISISDDLSKFQIKKINSLLISGEFCRKEYLYLLNSITEIRQKNCIFKLEEIPTVDIDIDFTDMDCYKCEKKIEEDSYLYYCRICKTKYCYECVQEQLKNKGKEKFIDPKHNLIFFKTRDKNQFLNIQKSRLGNNKFSESIDESDFDTKHSAKCNGCRGNFAGTERYICLKCRKGKTIENGFIDYCGKCIEKMCTDKEEKKKLEENADELFYNSDCNKFVEGHKIKTRHKHDSHIYLYLPLQYKHVNDGPYYNF